MDGLVLHGRIVPSGLPASPGGAPEDGRRRACHLRSRTARPDYVETLWGLVNRADVTERFSTVTSTKI